MKLLSIWIKFTTSRTKSYQPNLDVRAINYPVVSFPGSNFTGIFEGLKYLLPVSLRKNLSYEKFWEQNQYLPRKCENLVEIDVTMVISKARILNAQLFIIISGKTLNGSALKAHLI